MAPALYCPYTEGLKSHPFQFSPTKNTTLSNFYHQQVSNNFLLINVFGEGPRNRRARYPRLADVLAPRPDAGQVQVSRLV